MAVSSLQPCHDKKNYTDENRGAIRTVYNGTWNGFLKLNCTFPDMDPTVVRWNQVGVACSLADGDVTLMPKTMLESGKGVYILMSHDQERKY